MSYQNPSWYVYLKSTYDADTTLQYMTDDNPLQSVTHEKDLDEFLSSAALADTDFTAGKSKVEAEK